jgi:hypothetical protein
MAYTENVEFGFRHMKKMLNDAAKAAVASFLLDLVREQQDR